MLASALYNYTVIVRINEVICLKHLTYELFKKKVATDDIRRGLQQSCQRQLLITYWDGLDLGTL